MEPVRIFFTKTGPAAYISHLDLQRVMARALRKSGMPVWYSQGYNPHIYMSFAMPLPLGQQSLYESVDCKTEAGLQLCTAFAEPLNAALPNGIRVTSVLAPRYSAGQINASEYTVTYPGCDISLLRRAAGLYNSLPLALAIQKTKRSERTVDLKIHLPSLAVQISDVKASYLGANSNTAGFRILLPAGEDRHINPAVLCNFLHKECGLPLEDANIVRVCTYVGENLKFQ